MDKTLAKSHNRTIDSGFVEHLPIAKATVAVRYEIKSTSKAWPDKLENRNHIEELAEKLWQPKNTKES